MVLMTGIGEKEAGWRAAKRPLEKPPLKRAWPGRFDPGQIAAIDSLPRLPSR